MTAATLPPVVRLGGSVLVSGTALVRLRHALRLQMGKHRRDGLSQLPPELALLVTAINAAADAYRESLERSESAAGHAADVADMPTGPDVGISPDWLTTAEAAARLRISERQMRRMAGRLWSTKVSGRRVFDRADVEALSGVSA